MNGNTARNLMVCAGVAPLVASIAIAVPAYQHQADQEKQTAVHKQRLNAIASAVLANRCIAYPKGTYADKYIRKGGQILNYTARSLHTSCIAHRGHFGFIAIQDGVPTIQQVYTQTQVDATISQIQTVQ